MKKSGLTVKKKKLVVVFCAILFILAGIQFTSPSIKNPPSTSEIALPADVMAILKRACFDCHSNNSSVEWFDRIAPVSYLVSHDINEGRSRFNFSEWERNPPAVRELLLWEMVNAIEEKKMPLPRYLRMHPEAAVSTTELEILKRYVNTLPGRHKVDTMAIARALPDSQIQQLMKAVPVSANGIAYSDDYKNWKIISTTDKYDGGSMRIVYGNDIMVNAIAANKLPFPDGAQIVKVVWGKQREDSLGNVFPGNFQNVQLMIKDSKRFSSTEGWGFAKFDGLQLKPFGASAIFQTTCINCHRLLVPDNDFVFNIPTK
ncbi:MAG: heme-binding domain-containing protein [Chitinophagaceae bacterium]